MALRGGFGAEGAAFGATAPPSAAIQPAPAGFASVIAADFPALFAEFRGKRFQLLWRGSCDAFSARFSRQLPRPRADSLCGMGNSDPKAIFRRQIRAKKSAQFPISICTEG
jgi:hypothetical protein